MVNAKLTDAGAGVLTSGAALPALGGAASVHARNDDYGLVVKAIEDGVGEVVEQGAPGFAMDHCLGGGLYNKVF